MKGLIGLIAATLATVAVQAQASKDKPNVDKLCGCFEVEFKYAETFSPNKDYKFHDREEISGGTELILPIEMTDKKIVMQHLLVITDSIIVKHWREEWTYENTTLWKYKGDQVWSKEQLNAKDVKGKWTQTVWEVSDAPRYQGASDWMTVDGKTVWQNTADAPLPRREYSVRSDYNILKRTNRIVINNEGWVHEQDNQKIIRKDGKDHLLAEEKGLNTYKRVEEGQCAAGKAYWDKTKSYWTKVRKAWDEYTASHNTVELKSKVDGKVLHDHLFALEKEVVSGKVKPEDVDARIKSSLDKFMGKDKEVATVNAQH